jgi:hypothetical protein
VGGQGATEPGAFAESDLIPGAEPTAAAKLTLELLSANASLMF